LGDKETLINLSRDLEISGYSKLKKEDLKQLLLQNIYPDKNLLREKLRYFKDSILNLLSIYINFVKDDKVALTILKDEFQKVYKAKSTFHGALMELQQAAIIFRLLGDETTEADDLIVVPEEFMPVLKEILLELGHLTVKVEAEEKIEEIELNSMENLLKTFFKKKLLVNWLSEKGLPSSGNFERVIQRVTKSEQFSYGFLSDNLDKSALRDICIDLELTKTGDKESLAINIWNKLMNANIPKPKKAKKAEGIISVKDEETESVGTTISPESEGLVVGSEPSSATPEEAPKEQPFMKILREQLDDIELDPLIRNAEALKAGVYMSIKNAQFFKHSKDIEVQRFPDKFIADIVIKKDDLKVGIVSTYIDQIHPTQTLKNIKAKIFDLKDEFGENFLFILYDPGTKTSISEIEKLQRSVKLVYKNADSQE
jgi:hypothetical protein